MRKLRCYACGKFYDFDEDAFCSHCGAFNQPAKASLINASGEVERVDGINEAGHAHSFVHEELHAENRLRRRTSLEQAAPPARRAAQRGGSSANASRKPIKLGNFISYGVLLLIIINLLVGIFSR